MVFWLVDFIIEDYEMIDEFVEEIVVLIRKRKVLKVDNKKSKMEVWWDRDVYWWIRKEKLFVWYFFFVKVIIFFVNLFVVL